LDHLGVYSWWSSWCGGVNVEALIDKTSPLPKVHHFSPHKNAVSSKNLLSNSSLTHDPAHIFPLLDLGCAYIATALAPFKIEFCTSRGKSGRDQRLANFDIDN
jgi:hypothetical protein